MILVQTLPLIFITPDYSIEHNVSGSASRWEMIASHIFQKYLAYTIIFGISNQALFC